MSLEDLSPELSAEAVAFLDGAAMSTCLFICKSLKPSIIFAINQRLNLLQPHFEFELPRITGAGVTSSSITVLSEFCALVDYLQQGLRKGLWTIYIGPISKVFQYNEQSPLVLKTNKLHPNLLHFSSENLATSAPFITRLNAISMDYQAISTYLAGFHAAEYHAVGYVDIDECSVSMISGFRMSFFVSNEVQIANSRAISNFSRNASPSMPDLLDKLPSASHSACNILCAFHFVKDSPTPFYCDQMLPFMAWNIMRKERDELRHDFCDRRENFCRCRQNQR